MSRYKNLYDDFRFLALVPAKIITGFGILATILFLLIAAIDFGQNSYTGWNVWSIGWSILLVILGIIDINLLTNIQKYPKYYRKEYEQLGYDFQESHKLTRYLQRLLRSKVDSSSYISSANRQNQIENNLIRLGSFVICFRQSIYIFILRTGGIDGRRDINDLNEIARELANFTNSRNSSFQQFTTEYKPPLGNRRLVNYIVQRLDR
ncbi:hypothetical protein [Lactobacillus gallinarum]|uniref:hypothetical protein n=1 Tax=Lactobacillus gallinarum TaxID=52242 RepID=UPI00388F0380